MQEKILNWIDEDRDSIITFLQDFVRARSPNPPGDTRAPMRHVSSYLDAQGIAYDLVVRDETMPNLVSSISFGEGDRHLVLNGHIDVFPVVNEDEWSMPPWEGEIKDGAIYGRGIADMKVGTTASILTFVYLSRLALQLKGRLTLTVVSDEETFGPNGARYLFDTIADQVSGTACLNGEPSSAETVRFGEKGAVWLRFTVVTPGGHGAYTHLSPSAIDNAYALMADLRGFTKHTFTEPHPVTEALDACREAYDAAYGKGASEVARKITMNVGTLKAGPKVNMIASRAVFEVDFRLPIGVDPDVLFVFIEGLRARHDFTVETLLCNAPNWIAPDNPLTEAVKRRAAEVVGIAPRDVTSLGNTDARLWRYRGVPAVVYGPSPSGMGSSDEHTPIEEALNVIRVHALSALDYLSN